MYSDSTPSPKFRKDYIAEIDADDQSLAIRLFVPVQQCSRPLYLPLNLHWFWFKIELLSSKLFKLCSILDLSGGK